MPRRNPNPYRPGSLVTVAHTCAHHGPALATLRVTGVKTLIEAHRWRLTMRRCDDTLLEVEVNADGRDDDGLVAPAGTTPVRGGLCPSGPVR
jgi:hypothetical protein